MNDTIYRTNAPRTEEVAKVPSLTQIQLEGETLAFYDSVAAKVFADLRLQLGLSETERCAVRADEAAVAMVIARERRKATGIFY